MQLIPLFYIADQSRFIIPFLFLFSVSVILKERKGTDSVTLAWQGPEPSDGTVVEYEVTYYEKVSSRGLSQAHTNNIISVTFCPRVGLFGSDWAYGTVTFIRPLGEAVMLIYRQARFGPNYYSGTLGASQNPSDLSHFCLMTYFPEHLRVMLRKRMRHALGLDKKNYFVC